MPSVREHRQGEKHLSPKEVERRMEAAIALLPPGEPIDIRKFGEVAGLPRSTAGVHLRMAWRAGKIDAKPKGKSGIQKIFWAKGERKVPEPPKPPAATLDSFRDEAPTDEIKARAAELLAKTQEGPETTQRVVIQIEATNDQIRNLLYYLYKRGIIVKGHEVK